jgi:hypothetical protein
MVASSFLRAQFADSPEPPVLLCHLPDTGNGWEIIRTVMRALETHDIKSLELPIQLGEGGPNSFVIG